MLGTYSDMFYKHHVGVAPDLQSALDQRLRSRFGHPAPAAYPDQALAIADLRIRPLSREGDCAGRLWLLRTMDWDPVFADSAIVEAYGLLTVSQVLNGDILNRAVRQLSPPAAVRIRDINTSGTVGASNRQKNVEFIVASARRKLRELVWPAAPNHETPGSWPEMHDYVARSAGLASLWASVSFETKAQIAALVGNDPWRHTLVEWGARDPELLLRLLTLALWLDQETSLNVAAHVGGHLERSFEMRTHTTTSAHVQVTNPLSFKS
jgi:hypothetical protein